MKKVTFIKKTPSIFVDESGKEYIYKPSHTSSNLKEGTGLEIELNAMFIDWGLDTDERMGSWTVAIVQLEDGSIEYVHPVSERMKFIISNEHENGYRDIMEERIKKLKEIELLQCSKDNYDVDEYMRGMANGLILASSCIEDTKPNFISK